MAQRFALALAVGLLAAALNVPSAAAGLLFTGPASSCDTATSQPFQPWSDNANYVLVPGGSFETGATGWTLRGGAAVASGNETFYVRAAGDRYSLHLPPGSSAITPTTCFALGDWHLRFFTRSGNPSSVKVDVVVKSLLGVLSIVDGGSVSASGQWRPSPRVGLLLTNVTSLVGTRAVAFRFRVSGSAPAVQVDDVYLDPWKSY